MTGSQAAWQERLDLEGRVEFRDYPLLPAAFLVVDLAALLWITHVVRSRGLNASLVMLLVFVVPLTVGSMWLVVRGLPVWLTVVRDGIELRDSRVIPFDQIVEIELRGARMTIREGPGGTPDEDGLGSHLVVGRKSPVFQQELAEWLLRLGAGPAAEIVRTKRSLTTVVLTRRPRLP